MITLLDGTVWDKAELLEKMNDDEFYYGYLSKAALSSSSVKLLLDSPKTYRNVTEYGSEESQALRDGWLFHTAILEPEVFSSQIFVDVASKNTKAYREAKEQHGKVFTMTEKNDAERIADAFLRNTKAIELSTSGAVENIFIYEKGGFCGRYLHCKSYWSKRPSLRATCQSSNVCITLLFDNWMDCGNPHRYTKTAETARKIFDQETCNIGDSSAKKAIRAAIDLVTTRSN